MVCEVYPSSFLDSFKGPILTSKSIFLSTKNIFTFGVDRHLDKPLTKAILEFILEVSVDQIQTRPNQKRIRLPGQIKKRCVKTKLKTIQVSFTGGMCVNWMSY